MHSEEIKTVVFIESAAAMGGVQFSTLYLAQNLNRSCWQTIVVCPEDGDLPSACRNSGIDTQIIDYPRLWSTSVRVGSARLPNPGAWVWDSGVIVSAARRLRRFLVQRKPDLIVTKGLSSHFLGGLAARSLGIPCVWHVQDLISERSFGIYRRAFSLAAGWLPDQVIADGAAIASQLPAALRPRTRVIHNGVDTNTFRPGLDGSVVRQELGIPLDHLVVGNVGRLTPWKGQHHLIEAFARMAKDHPNVTGLLAGAPVFDNDAYQSRLQNLTAEFGLQDRVKFAGYRHDLPNVLAAMDIFAFTSIEKDTSPLALLSAMSSGLPIAAFDIDGVRELMTSDQCLISPVGNSEGLSESLRQLIADRGLRQRLGANAREVVMNKLSLELFTRNCEEVFVKVATDNSAVGDDAGYARTRLAGVQN